jgi:hypothetical protein
VVQVQVEVKEDQKNRSFELPIGIGTKL